MISERQFAALFASAWRLCAPRSREVLADLNRRTVRFALPVEVAVPPERRSLVGELGFRLFESMAAVKSKNLSDAVCLQVHADVEVFIRALLPPSRAGYFNEAADHRAEIACAVGEARILYELFEAGVSSDALRIGPEFRGCGLVDKCRGDLEDDQGTLYEVKSRLGKFEQVDLRQLVIYAVLAHLERPGKVLNVSLVNPNQGVYFVEPWDTLVLELSGLPTREFVNNVVELITPDVLE